MPYTTVKIYILYYSEALVSNSDTMAFPALNTTTDFWLVLYGIYAFSLIVITGLLKHRVKGDAAIVNDFFAYVKKGRKKVANFGEHNICNVCNGSSSTYCI